MRFEVIDNFLSHKEWLAQYETVFSHKFPWTYGFRNEFITASKNSLDSIASSQNFKSLLFQHWFHGEERPKPTDETLMYGGAADIPNTKQPYWDILCQPILDKFSIKRVLNIRTNLYTWWHESNNTSGTHRDFNIETPYLTLIYYINGSDGVTWFEGQGNIEKIPNRIVIADGKIPHRCVYQTNTKAQVATNINIIV